MTLVVLGVYLLLVLSIGLASHRLFRGTGEDYALATRSIGPFVLLMSLFGTHMTAFSLLGASGESYRVGLGVFSLMASSSAILIPLIFFFVGTRLWALGKRFGYTTQPQYFRDRFDSPFLGQALFAVLVALVVPYLLIGVMGGGVTLSRITGGDVPAWVGGAAISLVVLTYVSFGGLRGTAWANTFQTLVFMTLGAVTLVYLVRQLGGLDTALTRIATERPDLLARGDAIPPAKLLSYTLIPLSAGMFPHLFMHWLSAKRVESFKLPIVAYPLCIAAVWVPSVLLGMFGRLDFPDLEGAQASSVLIRMIHLHAPELLAGLLGAGVFAAVMSSLDSQVLALSNMFAHDVYDRRGTASEAAKVRAGRLFVIGLIVLTFLLSLVADSSIFGLAVWSFTGFSGLFPLVLAALFWRRATAAGALAALATTAALWIYFFSVGWQVPGYSVGGTGILPVVPIVGASALAMVVVSLLTPPPAAATVRRFFPAARAWRPPGDCTQGANP
ncbi:MAG: sodium:solute symporter family protein [Acidobacteriota bacterium]